jgi:hypothetical protein
MVWILEIILDFTEMEWHTVTSHGSQKCFRKYSSEIIAYKKPSANSMVLITIQFDIKIFQYAKWYVLYFIPIVQTLLTYWSFRHYWHTDHDTNSYCLPCLEICLTTNTSPKHLTPSVVYPEVSIWPFSDFWRTYEIDDCSLLMCFHVISV